MLIVHCILRMLYCAFLITSTAVENIVAFPQSSFPLFQTLDDVCIPSLSGLYYNADQPRPLSHPLMPVPHTHTGECDTLFPWRQFVQRSVNSDQNPVIMPLQ